MALGTTAWCAAATSFNSYLAARIVNGFFATVCQAVSILLRTSAKNARPNTFPLGRLNVHPGCVLFP